MAVILFTPWLPRGPIAGISEKHLESGKHEALEAQTKVLILLCSSETVEPGAISIIFLTLSVICEIGIVSLGCGKAQVRYFRKVLL